MLPFLTGWHYMLFIIDLTRQYSGNFLWIFSDIEQGLGAKDLTSVSNDDAIQESLQTATGNMSHPADMRGSWKREKECVNPTRAETITTVCLKSHGEANITSADKESQIRWLLDEPPYSAISSYIFRVLLCDSSQFIYWEWLVSAVTALFECGRQMNLVCGTVHLKIWPLALHCRC